MGEKEKLGQLSFLPQESASILPMTLAKTDGVHRTGPQVQSDLLRGRPGANGSGAKQQGLGETQTERSQCPIRSISVKNKVLSSFPVGNDLFPMIDLRPRSQE